MATMKRKREVLDAGPPVHRRAACQSSSPPRKWRRIAPPRRAKAKAPGSEGTICTLEPCQLPTPTSVSISHRSSPQPPPTPSPWAWRSIVVSPVSGVGLNTCRNNLNFGDEVCRAYRTNELNEHLRKHKYGIEVASEWKKGSTPEEARFQYAQKQEELHRLADEGDTSSNASGDETGCRADACEREHDSARTSSDGEVEAAITDVWSRKASVRKILRKTARAPSPASSLPQA